MVHGILGWNASMTARGKQVRRPKGSCILVFGEDENDTRSLREIVLAAVPGFTGNVKALRRPPVYSGR